MSVVVALPRERFSGALRKRLQEMFMARFHGTSVDYHLSLGETESARIFFTVHVEPGTQIPEIPYEELELEVEELARTWTDDLVDHLTEAFGAERGPLLAAEYGPRFPDYYKVVETDWEQVGIDVAMLDRLKTATDGFVVGITNENIGERLTRVKLYKTGGKVDLSAFMPLLESLGLRAVEEVPTAIQGEGKVYIHDFGVLDARGAVLDLEAESDLVRDSLSAMWRGQAEVRLAEPPGDLRGTVMAAGADPARLPEVPHARVDAVHRGVPQRRPRREPAPRAAAGRAVRGEVRPGARGGRRRDPGVPATHQG